MTLASSHFFVDEAGDLSFFDRKGRVIVGKEGVSNYFMVGVAEIPEPDFVHALMSELRADLLADPYFRGVPSMSPSEGKTARSFHASKDPIEVRRDVMARLGTCKAKIYVAIRRKASLVTELQQQFAATGKKLTVGTLYDDLVKRLFRDRLHKAERNRIVFARHAKWGRREAMAQAIQRAQSNFQRKHGIVSNKPTDLVSAEPHEHGGLQVVDYYLWALQRMYEKREDRYFEYLRPAYRLIMDLDDKCTNAYGEYYSDSNPISLDRIMPPAS